MNQDFVKNCADLVVNIYMDKKLKTTFEADSLGGISGGYPLIGATRYDVVKDNGNESGSETVNVTLKYYCQNFKHVFSLSDNITLNYDESTGIGEAYIPEFTYGSTKYPVVKTVNAETQLARAGIKPASDGVVGAFVDDECRGLATSSASSISPLVIYCRNDGESVTLKYYDAIKGQLYTIPDIIK